MRTFSRYLSEAAITAAPKCTASDAFEIDSEDPGKFANVKCAIDWYEFMATTLSNALRAMDVNDVSFAVAHGKQMDALIKAFRSEAKSLRVGN